MPWCIFIQVKWVSNEHCKYTLLSNLILSDMHLQFNRAGHFVLRLLSELSISKWFKLNHLPKMGLMIIFRKMPYILFSGWIVIRIQLEIIMDLGCLSWFFFPRSSLQHDKPFKELIIGLLVNLLVYLSLFSGGDS